MIVRIVIFFCKEQGEDGMIIRNAIRVERVDHFSAEFICFNSFHAKIFQQFIRNSFLQINT